MPQPDAQHCTAEAEQWRAEEQFANDIGDTEKAKRCAAKAERCEKKAAR